MTTGVALTWAEHILSSTSDSARLDAEVLLATVMAKDRAAVLSELDEELTDDQAKTFHAWVGERAHHTPIAYIKKQQPFFGLSLFVSPDVLIPRPATELLVDHVLGKVASDQTIRIADIGTGSGAIALALAVNLPNANIMATDISSKALSIAHYNARHSRLTNRVSFHHGSLLEPLNKLPRPDVIVANLPYLRPEQLSEPSIQQEPSMALDGGTDGLALVWQLLDQLHTVYPFQGLVLELDPSQIEQVGNHLTGQWPEYTLSKISDGHADRGVAIWT